MRAYKNYVWIMVLLLASCASIPTPETNNERLALLEITFGTLIDKANLYKQEGRFDVAQKADVSAALHDIDLSIEAATIALTALDQGAFDNSTRAINTGMVLLRKLLVEAESQ